MWVSEALIGLYQRPILVQESDPLEDADDWTGVAAIEPKCLQKLKDDAVGGLLQS
jgi:hypothetical protein